MFDDFATWKTIARSSGKHPMERHQLQDKTKEAMKALRNWLTEEHHRQLAQKQTKRVLVITDASLCHPIGRWAAITVTSTVRAFGGIFPEILTKKSNIADLELAAVRLAIAKTNATGSEVIVLCDNQPVVNIIEKGRSSAPRLHQQMLSLRRVAKAQGLSLKPYYINTKANPADAFSRGKYMNGADGEHLRDLVQKNGMVLERKVSYTQINKNFVVVQPWESINLLNRLQKC
jgi:hypothetical protein